MELKVLSLEDLEQVRLWRNNEPQTLRTPYPLTKEMQEDYYYSVIANRDSTTRYWGIYSGSDNRCYCGAVEAGLYNGPPCPYHSNLSVLVGYGGIENIQRENSIGEISILIGPDYRGKGYGRQAVAMVLDKAFFTLNLNTVFGEVYSSGPVGFWEKIVKHYGQYITVLPDRKYYQGKYYYSLYFSFNRECIK